VARPHLTGWSSTERQSPDGAVEFEQRARATRPLVELSERGAIALGTRYWEEVEAATGRLVRVRASGQQLELRLLGRWTLLRFGTPTFTVDDAVVSTRFPIAGGLLARAPGGSITFAQIVEPAVELRATIEGFHPRLGGSPGGPPWAGALYRHVQRRLHTSVSRRYFRRLISEGPR
jgi:hypothetical protein